MGMDKTARFKERNSNSFRKLQRSQNQPQESIKATPNVSLPPTENFTAIKDSKVEALNRPVSSATDVKLSPKLSDSPGNSAAKPLSLKEQIKTLEPIKEVPTEKFEKLADSIRGPFTESEVQELLLSYTYTSGMIDGTKSNLGSALFGKHYSHLKTKIRKKWTSLALKSLDSVDKLQSKLYEYFWLCAVYLNVWFPKLTSFFRYVID